MKPTGEIRGEMLKHFHKLGYSLRECMHPMRLGYRPAALAKAARVAGVYFADLDEIEAEGKELAAKRRA